MGKRKLSRKCYRGIIPYKYGNRGRLNLKCFPLDEFESIETAQRKTRARLHRLDKGRSIFGMSKLEEQDDLIQGLWDQIVEQKISEERIAA